MLGCSVCALYAYGDCLHHISSGALGAGGGPCRSRASTGGCAVGPPLYSLPSVLNENCESKSQSQERCHDGTREVEYLPPVRFLDATECLWNAFLRLGNLAIVNCVSVISSHPLELETLKEAATLVARRNQALRLVIRLTDTKAVARHLAQEQAKYRLLCHQKQQPLHTRSSSDDLLKEESTESCSSYGRPFPSAQPHSPANLCSNSNSSFHSRMTRYTNGKRAPWGLRSSRRNVSHFSGRSTATEVGDSKVRSCSLSSGKGSISESEERDGSSWGFPLPCKCRRRADLRFTFHERLGEPVVDVRYATVNESFSSCGLRWHQQPQGLGPQVDLGLLQEYPWMKAMAWEQKVPFNCEEGENTLFVKPTQHTAVNLSCERKNT